MTDIFSTFFFQLNEQKKELAHKQNVTISEQLWNEAINTNGDRNNEKTCDEWTKTEPKRKQKKTINAMSVFFSPVSILD